MVVVGGKGGGGGGLEANDIFQQQNQKKMIIIINGNTHTHIQKNNNNKIRKENCYDQVGLSVYKRIQSSMYNEYAVYKVRAHKSTGWIDHVYIYIRTHPPFRRPIHSSHISFTIVQLWLFFLSLFCFVLFVIFINKTLVPC